MFGDNSFIRAIMIKKKEVLNLDFRKIDEYIKMSEEDFFNNTKNSLVLFVDGYDNDKRELYDIIQVRKYFRELLKRHPYLFYYLNTNSWQLVYLCSCVNIAKATQESKTNIEIQFRKDVEFVRNVIQSTINYDKLNDVKELEDFVGKLTQFMLTGILQG